MPVQIEGDRLVDGHPIAALHIRQQRQRIARLGGIEGGVKILIIGDIVALCYAGGKLLAADRASAVRVYRGVRAGVAAGTRAVGIGKRMLMRPNLNVIQIRAGNFSSVDELAVIVIEGIPIRQQIEERAAGIGIPDIRECAAGEENGIGITSRKGYLLVEGSALNGQLAIVHRDSSVEGTALDGQIAIRLHIQKRGASHPPGFPGAAVLDGDPRIKIELLSRDCFAVEFQGKRF